MTDTSQKRLTVRVQLDRCAGHGRCRDEAPEVFGYDPVTNKAIVREGADLTAQKDLVSLAIHACPEFALSWAEQEDDEGSPS